MATGTTNLFAALTKLAEAATNWLQRQTFADRGDGMLVYRDEARCPVEGDAEWQAMEREIDRLQQEVADWRQRRNEDARGIAVLLSNYETLAGEVDALKKSNAVLYPQELCDYIDKVDAAYGKLFDALAERMTRAECHLAASDGTLRSEPVAWRHTHHLELSECVRNLVEVGGQIDSVDHLERRIAALTAEVASLREIVQQAEQRQSGWQRMVDATLGRRPRG